MLNTLLWVVYILVGLIIWSSCKLAKESDEEMDRVLQAHMEARAYAEALRIKKGE